MSPRWIIGLASGASADEVDAALLEVEGVGLDMRPRLVGSLHQPYGADLKDMIRRRLRSGPVRGPSRSPFCTACSARASPPPPAPPPTRPASVCKRCKSIGCPGHTVWHDGEGRFPSTLPLGMAAVVAERCGVTTVSDFRCRDVAAGGQGVPLAALTDHLLFRSPREGRVLVAPRRHGPRRLPAGRRPAGRRDRLRGGAVQPAAGRADAPRDRRPGGIRRRRQTRRPGQVRRAAGAGVAGAPVFLPTASEMSAAARLRRGLRRAGFAAGARAASGDARPALHRHAFRGPRRGRRRCGASCRRGGRPIASCSAAAACATDCYGGCWNSNAGRAARPHRRGGRAGRGCARRCRSACWRR